MVIQMRPDCEASLTQTRKGAKMSNISDFFLINSLMGSKKEKYRDPVTTYKKIKALLEEGKKDKDKKDNKGTKTFELGMFFFACVPLIVPILLWVQLSYIMRIAELLQQHAH